MKRWLLSLLVLLSVNSFALVGGYYTNWDVYNGYPVTNNNQLTRQVAISDTMYYAFFFVTRYGQIQFSDSWSDLSSTNPTDAVFCKANPSSCPGFRYQRGGYGNFDSFTHLPLPNKIISLGGGSSAGVASFNNAFYNIPAFIKSLQALQKSYAFTGVDLDFEPSSMTRSQAASFVKLVTAIHTTMPDLTITFPIPAYSGFLNKFTTAQWAVLQPNLTYVMIMGYDMVGSWTYPAVTGLLSDLKQDDIMRMALNAIGVPNSQIILGVPGYLAVLGGVASDGLGIRFSTSSYSTPTYKSFIGSNTLPIINVDNRGMYVYDAVKKTFTTGDSIDTMAAKAQYVKDQGMAGIVMWSISMDVDPIDPNSLLSTFGLLSAP